MCGIAGIISFDGFDASASVRKMTSLLSHRGPDGSGIESVGDVTFGHRRLSIIDLSLGAQPMWSHDRKFLVCFNGEIYNYIELREELKKQGAQFRTNSDTEVIIESFRYWGESAFLKFNGQFAFALHDTVNNQSYLCRDLFGEKPLYYAVSKERVLFASELKSVLSEYGQFEIDPVAFSDYCSLNYFPFKETMVRGIKKLSPGTFLKIKRSGITEHPIGPFPNLPELQGNLVDEFSTLFDSSVNFRLRSDVPVGVFLSSGIDSALTLSSAVKHSSKITAFTANFSESSFSEVAGSQLLAKHFGVKHEVIDIDLNNLGDLIPSLVYHADEPLADSSALPMYILSKETSKKVKVVLSGDGGDELFGGYLTYDATLLAQDIPQLVRHFLRPLSFLLCLGSASNRKVSVQEKLDRFLRNIDLPPAAAHFAWNGMFRAREKTRLLGPAVRESADRETFLVLAEKVNSVEGKISLPELMRADQQTYLPNDILNKADRMSMASGLEIRPVFLDPRINAFSHLASRRHPELFANKQLLKLVLRGRIGSHYRIPKKQGFSIPIHLWFRTKLREFAGDLFHSGVVKTSGLYNQEELLRLWQQHQERKRNLGFELWGCMVALLWYRKFA